MRRAFLITFFITILSAACLHAIPAYPGKIKVTQPDGSSLYVLKHGDEWGHWTTDQQGRVVRKDADGWWRTTGESGDAARRKAARHRAAHRLPTHRGPARSSAGLATGQKHFLVILVQFSNLSFSASDPQTAFKDLMNKQGYSDNDGTGSVRDYFYDNSQVGSQHLFEPVFDVYGPVTLEEDYVYYGENDNYGNDVKADVAVREACEKLDSQIDFSKYDSDGDGTVDLVFVYYAGYGEADYYDEDTIWPHQWELSDKDACGSPTLDGKKVDAYSISNELIGYGDREGTMVGIGTTCHEFAHAIGLPDFYDSDYDDNGIAAGLFDFSLMSGGSYNNDGHTPPYLNIEERILLGWLDESALTEISNSGAYTLGPVQENKAYKTTTDQEGEYFVYECRGDSGWDQHQPAHGLIVYHVDKSSRNVRIQIDEESFQNFPAAELWSDWEMTNAINENGSHPCFYIVPAVDQGNLSYGFEYLPDYGASYFDPDDVGLAENIPFPAAGDVTTFTAKSWNGVDSDIALSNISYSGDKVSFTVTAPEAYSLAYYTIQNPKAGVYSVDDSFQLGVSEVASKPYTSIKWYLDGTEVTGTSVTLNTAGTHKIKADITLQSGKRQVVTLEIKVQ